MNAPPERAVRIESRPSPQFGHRRGSVPSPASGKMWGASTSLILSSTSPIRRSAVSSMAAWNSSQKRRSTSFQSAAPALTSSSWFSMSAVKSYST